MFCSSVMFKYIWNILRFYKRNVLKFYIRNVSKFCYIRNVLQFWDVLRYYCTCKKCSMVLLCKKHSIVLLCEKCSAGSAMFSVSVCLYISLCGCLQQEMVHLVWDDWCTQLGGQQLWLAWQKNKLFSGYWIYMQYQGFLLVQYCRYILFFFSVSILWFKHIYWYSNK